MGLPVWPVREMPQEDDTAWLALKEYLSSVNCVIIHKRVLILANLACLAG